MTTEIRDRLRRDLVAARRTGDHRRGWQSLEDAHVLSQPWAWWHIRVHGAMFAAGVRERDVREVWGQLVRLIVAGPGSISRRYPLGNTGHGRYRNTGGEELRGMEMAQIVQPYCVEPRIGNEPTTYALRIGSGVSASCRFMPSTWDFADVDFHLVPPISPVPAEYLGQDLGRASTGQ